MPRKKTHEEFITELKQRNIDYPDKQVMLVDDQHYKNLRTKLKFSCKRGHTWCALPTNILHNASGCLECSGKRKKTHDEFIAELNQRNISNPDKRVMLADGEEYKSAFMKLTFTCDGGHFWIATPSNIVNNNQGCLECSGKRKKTHAEFVAEVQEKTTFTIKDSCYYVKAQEKMSFVCSGGHEWQTRPADILQGYGCPQCKHKGYSQKAIEWINQIANDDDIFIHHAENGGEFKIPGTRYHCDGYCKETHTVYEFYGDKFHGNPDVFKPNETCHPYDKRRTANSLFKETIDREKIILKKGFQLIYIWEKTFDEKHNT